jgi:hypothetical protein
MTTIIAPETDPLAWLQVDPSVGYVAAQRVLLRFDPQRWAAGDHPSLWVVTRCAFETGVPAPVYHGRWLEWELSPRVDAVALTEALNAGEADVWLNLIADGHTVEWDGHNLTGRLTEEASAACEGFAQWLRQQAEVAETGGLVEAADWFVPGEPVPVTAQTSDEDLRRIAEQIEAEARSEFCAVLVGTEQYLREVRSRLREEDAMTTREQEPQQAQTVRVRVRREEPQTKTLRVGVRRTEPQTQTLRVRVRREEPQTKTLHVRVQQEEPPAKTVHIHAQHDEPQPEHEDAGGDRQQ